MQAGIVCSLKPEGSSGAGMTVPKEQQTRNCLALRSC